MYAVAEGVATFTMTHVETRNAMTPELMTEFASALDRATGDPAVRVLVITNEGPVFCAGADLKAATPGPAGASGAPGLHDIVTRIQQLPIPVVARIAGHCVAGGIGLAAACDLSVAAEDVWFAFTEVRIGVAPVVVAAAVLPKLSRADAAELFLRGDRVGADRAAEVRLINRSVPRDRLDEAVGELTGALRLGGPQALGAVKELLRVLPTLEQGAAWDWAVARSAELFASDEAREGIAAFRRREPPPWASTAD